MPQSALVTTASQLRFHDVTSADGTRLRAWTNDAEGPTVLLSNGLGTNPYSWPSLLRPDCGVRVVSWNHRGVGGSARPVDGRVTLDSYVEDAIAVMDDAGIESAVVASWSIGVTAAFALLEAHPERIQAILGVAGVPGQTFSTMLAPLRVPRPVARSVTRRLAQVATVAGYPAAPLVRRIPWTNAVTSMLQRTRLINPSADTAQLRDMLQEFCTTHPAWYARLALAVGDHPRISLSTVQVPVTLVAGKWDLLTGARDMKSAADRIPHARYLCVDATHFIPLEQPQLVLDELHALLETGQDG